MPRQVRDSRLETRAARARLPARRKPYKRSVETGAAIGYRTTQGGAGRWLAILRAGAGYREHTIAPADDNQDADGVTILSFAQAQARVIELWRAAKLSGLGIVDERRGPYLVADAARDYEADFLARRGKGIATVRSVTARCIVPELGSVAIDRLTRDRLKRWKAGLVAGVDPEDSEAFRRRLSTVNRIASVLRAILNHALREERVATDAAWRTVLRPFRGADAPRIRFLSVDECQRLVNACDPDFRLLVRAGLLTGARYGELCALRVVDVNLLAGTVHIVESKSGKPRHIPLSDEGINFFAVAVRGKRPAEHVFIRESLARQGRPPRSDRKGPTEVTPDIRVAVRMARAAGETVAEIAKRFTLSTKTVIRHSRDLATGAPLAAALQERNASHEFQARAAAARAKAATDEPHRAVDSATPDMSRPDDVQRREVEAQPRTVRRPWKPSEQVRPMQAACKAARIDPPASFHVLRHAYASHLVSAGVPIAFVAEALGHADTRITSRHYAHLSPSHFAAAIRAHLPIFMAGEQSNVRNLEIAPAHRRA